MSTADQLEGVRVCYHPMSCALCRDLGASCGEHVVGSSGHARCGREPRATAHVVVDRQYGPPLAVRYGSTALASAALEGSPFVDSLCEADCLDAYVSLEVPAGAEVVIPPAE